MTNEAKQIFLAIAPIFIEKGIALQERIAATGSDPSKCTVGDKPIVEAYAVSAKEWAETFARVIDMANAGKQSSLIGRKISVRYTIDGAPAVSDGKIDDVEFAKDIVMFTIGKAHFALTYDEFGELLTKGEVSICDYFLTLVNE